MTTYPRNLNEEFVYRKIKLALEDGHDECWLKKELVGYMLFKKLEKRFSIVEQGDYYVVDLPLMPNREE